MGAVRGARAAPRRHRRLSEPRQPLWADGLAHQPAPAREAFFGAPPVTPAPERLPPPVSAYAVVMVLMAVVTAMAAVAIVTGRGARVRATVPSAWGEIPMRCDTTRFGDDDRALELFACRALPGAEGLPPGRYASPEAAWSSDLTGLPARASAIRITRDGRLEGVAVY